MQRYTIIKIVSIWLMTTQAMAEYKDFSVGFGLINEHVGLFRKDLAGNRNKFDFRALVEAQWFLEYGSWVVLPRVGMQFPDSTEQETITKYAGYIGVGVGRYVAPGVLLQLGSSYYLTYFTTDGGTSTLPNGDSTADFPLPESSSLARNVTTDIAAEFYLSKEFSLKTQLMVFNPLTSINRSFTYSLMIHYYFGKPI